MSNKSNLQIDENGKIIVKKPALDTNNFCSNLLEKAKVKIDKFLNRFYKLRCICCFTSVFAALGFMFLFAENIHLPQILEYLIASLWAVGFLSGLIACPIRLLGNTFKFVGSGIVLGLPFLGVGALIGGVIGLVISFGMIFFLPALVTIPYYINDLNYKDKYMD